MKYGILLIGFEYTNTVKWKSLPGIPADLYQSYIFSKNITKNILVFTDIQTDRDTSVLQRAILDGYVDSGLLSFIEDIKERKQYVQYQSEKKHGYTSNNFEKTIIKFISGLDRVVIYYSGHGKGGDIILPDNTHVPLSYLRQLISNKTNIDSQVLTILDCCESNGMELPFVYSNDRWLLNSKNFNKRRILCLSSTHLEEDSTATRSGSIFTRSLISFLKNNYNNYISMNDIKQIEGIYIHGSYPDIKSLWGWLIKPVHNNLDININNYSSIITIQLHDCQPSIDQSSSMTNYLRYHHNGRYE